MNSKYCYKKMRVQVLLWMALLLCLTHGSVIKRPNSVQKCNVTILGAGFAGVFAAYQLAPTLKSNLCLVESLDRFGGRVFDVAATPGGHVFGVGALRVTGSEYTMLDLAKQLKVSLQRQESDSELLRVRGQYFYRDVTGSSSQARAMCAIFSNIKCDFPNNTDPDVAMLSQLLDVYQQNRTVAGHYFDFVDYIHALFGDEGLAFIRESVRYNSLFTSVSTQGILDFFVHELSDNMGLDPDRLYPDGGMSQYIDKMMLQVIHSGATIFTKDAVLTIDDFKGSFIIETQNHSIISERVICAIDPLHMQAVGGSVGTEVTSAPEFNVIEPKKLAIVTAWWESRWWEESHLHRLVKEKISRVVSHENCFNTMDIPTFPFGRDQNVTRAVYDDGACVPMWEAFAEIADLDRLAEAVRDSLQNVYDDIEVPLPKHLHIQVWPNAWHLQKSTSTISNNQIFKWSQQPLKNNPHFALIGEGYNLDYTAWCSGALKSAMWVLTNNYGFTYPCLNDPGSPANCSYSNLRLGSQFKMKFKMSDAFP